MLQSNRSGEYLISEFLKYLEENGILSQWTRPGILQHNEISKRKNRTLLDMIRSMIGFASLSIFFRGYALETAYYILNKMPNKFVDKISYEMWTGRKPVFSHLRVWRYFAYIKHLKTDKLGGKSDRCLFIGYPKKTKGYYFYLITEQKVFVTSWIIFLKKEFLSEGAMPAKLNLMKFMRWKDRYTQN